MKVVAADIFIMIVTGLALASCERGTSSAPPAVTPTIAAPTAAPHQEADGEQADDITLVAEAEPDSGEVPLRVRFSVDALLDEELNQPTYTWDFGDGSPPSHERNPEHTYTKAGDYLATVRVVNKTGEGGWDEIDIEAEANELPAGEQ